MFKIETPQTKQEAIDKIAAFNAFIDSALKNEVILKEDTIKLSVTMQSKKDLIEIAEVYKAHYFEPCGQIPHFWSHIKIGRIDARLRSKDLKYKLIEE